MYQRTRKLMILPKALQTRDVDRLYVSRRVGERGDAGIEDSVKTSIERFEDYIEKRRGRLIIATRNNTNKTRASEMTISRKQKWEEKQLYGCFRWLIIDISHEKIWTWLRKENLKTETESLLITAKNNAIRTNHIKAKIDKTQQNSRCSLCGERDSTIIKLAQKE